MFEIMHEKRGYMYFQGQFDINTVGKFVQSKKQCIKISFIQMP